MDIKLITTDVDGTLVADDHITIPPINIEAISKAKESDIKIAISTGRPYSLTDTESMELGGVDYLILSNGAVVVDAKTLDVLYDCYLPFDLLNKIIRVLEKYPLVYELYAECAGYITKYTYEHYFETQGLPRVFLEDYRKRMILCDSPWDIARYKKVEKVNIDHIPEECIESLKEDLKYIPNLVYSAGYKGNMEITASGADKGRALAWLADHIGIEAENIMAFGDSGNDVTMLQYAAHSYAMTSGNDLAKNAAKYVTRIGNSEGGVGDIINEYLTKFKK